MEVYYKEVAYSKTEITDELQKILEQGQNGEAIWNNGISTASSTRIHPTQTFHLIEFDQKAARL